MSADGYQDNETMVFDLRRMHAEGATPAELLRHIEMAGGEGVDLIVLMRAAFNLPLSKTKAINAWMAGRRAGTTDDERLNRFLGPRMPPRES